MNATAIEWTDRTWNPVTGCTKVSPGCDNCYAENIARRFAGGPAFPNGFDVTLHWDRVTQPLRWRKPSRVFVNSMSDLFHDDVPDDFIARVFAVMAATPAHTYQVLTKRHGRMRSLLSSGHFADDVQEEVFSSLDLHDDAIDWIQRREWPSSNVWLGVSAEDQKRADLRIPHLLSTPAAVRFVSAEPLIGPLRLDPLWAHGTWGPGLDWVIVGGESGRGARPMDPAWAQDIVADCRDLRIAPFVKQLGSAYGPHKGGDMDTWPADLSVREFPGGGA
jgi:protein gp37